MKKGLIALMLLPAVLLFAGCNSTSPQASSASGTIHVPGYSIDQSQGQAHHKRS